jgi:extracellular factor (EF) 3-hydroxypalmitic acid methyl ester biosynthesis protein
VTAPGKWSTSAVGTVGGPAPNAANSVGGHDADPRQSIVVPQRQVREAERALQRSAARLTRLPVRGPDGELYHQALAALHELLACASAAERAGVSDPEMQVAAAPARAFCGRYSRTLAHTQRWPRGYPGDFELIEELLDGDPGSETGTLERALETCVLQLPIVWQHRVKVAWQAALVRRRLGGTGPIRVLSIGCGGARDLLRLEPHELGRLEIVLNDLDADALTLAAARLAGRVRQLTCLRGNALRSTTKMRAEGPFDVILVGGLLDYLPERAAQMLLRHAGGMLSPEGLLGATNIAAPNPWRPMLQLLAGWTLIERSHDQMSRLLRDPKLKASIGLDDSRLTWLAVASHPEARSASAD